MINPIITLLFQVGKSGTEPNQSFLGFEFINGENRRSLKIRGDEKFTIEGINLIQPNKIVECKIIEKENIRNINLLTRIHTLKELDYYKAGGILQYVLNSNIDKNS